MSKILNLQLENSRLARPFKTNLVHQYTNFALFRTLTISSLLAENFQLFNDDHHFQYHNLLDLHFVSPSFIYLVFRALHGRSDERERDGIHHFWQFYMLRRHRGRMDEDIELCYEILLLIFIGLIAAGL